MKTISNIIVNRKVATERVKVVPNAASGYYYGIVTKERAWTEHAMICLEIDVDRILREIGEKAVHSKGGKSQYMNGLIKAKVIKREESNVQEIVHDLPKGVEVTN